MALLINEVSAVLAAQNLAPAQLRAIVEELNRVEAEKAEEKAAAGPKAKNKLVPVILDPENVLRGRVFTGFVVQVTEETPEAEILPRLYRAAYTQNREAKRKRWAFRTLANIVESCKRAFLKNENVAIKGKQIVQVVVSDGNVPMA